MAQHLHYHAGKAALREDRGALHEQYDIMLADPALDALVYWILHWFDLLLGMVGVVVRTEKMQRDVGLSPTTQLSCPGAMWKTSPGHISVMLPSSIAAVAGRR